MIHFRRLLLLCSILLLAGVAKASYTYHFKPIHEGFDAIAQRLNQADFANVRQSIDPHWLDQLDSIAKKESNKQLQVRAIYWRIRSTQMSAQPSMCIPLLEKALKMNDDKNYDYDAACIHYQLAGNYDRIGQYFKCYNEAKQAIPVFEKYADHYFLGNSYLLLVQLFHEISSDDEARTLLDFSRDNYQKAGFQLNRIYFYQAVLTTGDDESIALYKKAIQTGNKDWGMTLQAYINLNELLLKRGRANEADAYSQEAFNMLSTYSPGNVIFHAMIALNHAKIRFEQGRYEETLNELTDLLQHSNQLRDEYLMLGIYQQLWLTHEKLGHRDEAYRYLELYNRKYRMQQEEILKNEIPKAQAREAIARQDDQIRLLQQEAELNRRRLWVLALLGLTILIGGGALLVYVFQRNRMHKMENRELQKSLEQEAIIYSMNLKNYEDDIQKKDREISSSTLLLTNKNEVLKQLSDITTRYSDEGKVPREFVREVNAVIGDSLKNDDEWSRFRLHFDSVHPDFFNKLKEASPELTENDLRLCAYIRIGMRAKQIAEMLSITADSVNSNRYRLRKKLGLSRGESLDDFVRKI